MRQRDAPPSWLFAAILTASLAGAGSVAHADPSDRADLAGGKILLATTTSVRDSGLLDTLVPVF